MRHRGHLTKLLVLGAFAAAAMAQTAAIEAPVLGYVFDHSANAVRPILGIPGAATMGDPVDAGMPLAWAEISAAGDYALAVSASSAEVVMLRLGRGGGVAEPIPGAMVRPAAVALSPGGTTAALYDLRARTVQILTGLPDNPSVSGQLDLPGDVASPLAVSEQGVVVAAVYEDSQYSLLASGRLLMRLGNVSDIRFLPGGHDVLVADSSAGQVLVVRDVAGAAEISVLVRNAAVTRPIAVALSGDRRSLFVANAGSESVVLVDLESGRWIEIACGCRPSRLDPMPGGAVFRLTGEAGVPIFLLDAGAEPRIVFVPPAETSVVARPPRSRGQQ